MPDPRAEAHCVGTRGLCHLRSSRSSGRTRRRPLRDVRYARNGLSFRHHSTPRWRGPDGVAGLTFDAKPWAACGPHRVRRAKVAQAHELESTVLYLGIEVDDVLILAEQTDLRCKPPRPP